MIAVEEYLLHILGQVKPPKPQQISVMKALGTVLAEDLPARVSVPPFTNSAMDGFAVRAADLETQTAPLTLPVTGDIPAGDTRPQQLQPGTARRIMTGAPLPQGADTVVKVEDTNLPAGPIDLPESVTIEKFPKAGANVRREGEDAAVGDIILRAGEKLTPAALSSAVSVGYESLAVYPRPKVAVISTGEELRPPGAHLEKGQIPDSNSVLLAGLVKRADGDLVGVWHSPDQASAFAEILAQASAKADVIITSGGVSAGAYDVVKEVGQAASLNFTKVAMQPGKPQGFGVLSAPDGHRVYVATLPGNPVSVFVSFHMFVRPVLAALMGLDGQEIGRTVVATVRDGWQSPAGKVQFVPVNLAEPSRPGETAVATPTHHLGSRSHLVASLHLANALAVIPAETTTVEPWSLIDVVRV